MKAAKVPRRFCVVHGAVEMTKSEHARKCIFTEQRGNLHAKRRAKIKLTKAVGIEAVSNASSRLSIACHILPAVQIVKTLQVPDGSMHKQDLPVT